MRAVLGIVSLLLVLAVVGLLAKKQLSATRLAVPALQQSMPPGQTSHGKATPAAGTASPTAPAASVRAQSQQLQQQYKERVEGLVQQPRPMPDGAN